MDGFTKLVPEPFDPVLVCALLPHLSDPIGALGAAHSVCKPDGLCIATASTWTDQDHVPEPMQFLPYTSIDRISWWLTNKAAYAHWFHAASFSEADVEDTLHFTPDRAVALDNGIRMNSTMVARLAHAKR